MSKIQKVTIEFDDHIKEVEGEDAEKWEMNNSVAYKYNNAPFQLWPINWKIVEKHPSKKNPMMVDALSLIQNSSMKARLYNILKAYSPGFGLFLGYDWESSTFKSSTVQEYSEIPLEDLCKIRNFGLKCIESYRKIITHYGFEIKNDPQRIIRKRDD